jgi:hypothetical protein
MSKDVCDVDGSRANTVVGQRSRTNIYRVSGMVEGPHFMVKPFLSRSELNNKPRTGTLLEYLLDYGYGLPHFGGQPALVHRDYLAY